MAEITARKSWLHSAHLPWRLRPRRAAFRLGAPLILSALALAVAGRLAAADAGALPLRPGETLPQPRQRGINEVAELPTLDVGCPACGQVVVVPEVDKLMRRAPGSAEALPWRMHAASRDADLCPHPGPGKLAYQADIVVCPSCGLAADLATYYRAFPPDAKQWVLNTFRPDLRAAQRRLLGQRSATMTEEEIIAFFNRQEEIPDAIRTEHARVLALARKDPALARARAAWLAAWAARREIAGPPRGDFLARCDAAVRAALAKSKRTAEGVGGDIAALESLLGRDRQGNERLPGPERLAARLMLAGLHVRLGEDEAALKILADAQAFCRDRYVRPDQDPLWPATTPKTPRDARQRELDGFRAEAEAEIRVRIDLVERQRTLLAEAANRIREAVAAGELDGDRDEALFHAYLAGEFLRRSGNLPLASEWFQLVLDVAPPEAPLARAARLQSDLVREQAGDKVNLLSSVGEDGVLLDRIRVIWKTSPVSP